MTTATRIAFLLFDQVTQLDLTGPAQILSRLGNTKIDLVAATRAPVATDCGFDLLPTATFADVANADILCIPGGMSTTAVMSDDQALDWVRMIAAEAQWVTSVCTGSLILAAAGLLEGKRATSHWAMRHHLAAFGAIPVAERVVFDGNVVTGGGVTAGIDFALSLIGAIRGEEHARLVQLGFEYDPLPPFDSGSPERAGPERIAHYQAIAAQVAPERDDAVEAIARRYRASRDGG